MEVKELSAGDTPRWDAFVQACPEATFCHRAGWKDVIEKVFGHRCYYLYAEEGGRILGVLPLGHVRSLIFGNALISTPFCVYGGSAVVDDRARRVLDEEAVRIAEQLQVDYLELRNVFPRHPEWPSMTELYVTFRKAIDPDPERNMLNIPRKQRAMVRKGMDAGLESRIVSDVAGFHAAYAASVRSLGTPVFPLSYFKTLREVFGEDCEILVVTRNGIVIAGVMSFYFRDEVLPYYGGGTNEARKLKGNDFMYWELMRRACERGIRVFDYGRSKAGTGSYSFKKNWGFDPKPLSYEYHLVRAKDIPAINPLNPKYRLFIEAWRRLPLAVTKWLGPRIVKNIG